MHHTKSSTLRGRGCVALLVGVLAVSASACAGLWEVRVLPEWASSPDISGNYVAYRIFDGDHDVRLYDISDDTITKVTDSNRYERYVSVSGPRVAWHDVSGDAIKLYDHSVGTTTTLDRGGTWNGRSNPKISGNNVVWEKDLGVSYDMHEIYLYHGGTVTRVTNNTYEDTRCQIDGNHVVWVGKKSADFDVFLYDIATQSTTQITDRTLYDKAPKVCGNNIVWMGSDGHDSEIFHYDIITGVTTQITNNEYYDNEPVVSNNRIAWYGSDGNDAEIFLYDISAGTTLQITDNEQDDRYQDLSDELLVWRTQVEGYSGGEVFAYDGRDITKLSLANSWANDVPRVDGRNVCWDGFTSGGSRVFVAVFIPEPGTLGLLGLGSLALARRRRRA